MAVIVTVIVFKTVVLGEEETDSGKHGPKQISCHLVASTDDSVFG